MLSCKHDACTEWCHHPPKFHMMPEGPVLHLDAQLDSSVQELTSDPEICLWQNHAISLALHKSLPGYKDSVLSHPSSTGPFLKKESHTMSLIGSVLTLIWLVPLIRHVSWGDIQYEFIWSCETLLHTGKFLSHSVWVVLLRHLHRLKLSFDTVLHSSSFPHSWVDSLLWMFALTSSPCECNGRSRQGYERGKCIVPQEMECGRPKVSGARREGREASRYCRQDLLLMKWIMFYRLQLGIRAEHLNKYWHNFYDMGRWWYFLMSAVLCGKCEWRFPLVIKF